eukprot:COSAG02_NODE_19_length_53976_cov_37.338512_2_plen_37_part_00
MVESALLPKLALTVPPDGKASSAALLWHSRLKLLQK